MKPSGISNNAFKAYEICKPKNPIGPIVPAATATIQAASTIEPKGPLITLSPNTGYKSVLGFKGRPLS